jgi:hypothetical protein
MTQCAASVRKASPTRTLFESNIPEELSEAAAVDGAS